MTRDELEELARIAKLPVGEVAKAMAEMKKRKRAAFKKKRDERQMRRKPANMTDADEDFDDALSLDHQRKTEKAIRQGSEALRAALWREHPGIVSRLLKQNPLRENLTGDE